jgi:hypothetical protein
VLFETKLTYPPKNQSRNLQNKRRKKNKKIIFFNKKVLSKIFKTPIQSSRTEAETYEIEKKINKLFFFKKK